MSTPEIHIFPKKGQPLHLQAQKAQRRLSGESKKKIYEDKEKLEYFVKESKARNLKEFFKYEANVLRSLKEYSKILGGLDYDEVQRDPQQEQQFHQRVQRLTLIEKAKLREIISALSPYKKHIEEVQLTSLFIELLASRLSFRLFSSVLISPQNHFHIEHNKGFIVSPSIGKFFEFLSMAPALKNAVTAAYWNHHRHPKFVELVHDKHEARLLGQAFAIALLFGHLDLVNHINLSNLGAVQQANGTLKLCIVDWGNCLGVGFNGLTADESSFRNAQFNFQDARFRATNYQPQDLCGFHHVVPFDGTIYPFLPRQIVPDLFNLTAKDAPLLRSAQRRGFYEVCEQAMALRRKMPSLIETTMAAIFKEGMSAHHVRPIKRLLPSFFKSTKKNEYNLATVLKERILSLHAMKCSLKSGISLHVIGKDRLTQIIASQSIKSLPTFSFFEVKHRVLKTADKPLPTRSSSRSYGHV